MQSNCQLVAIFFFQAALHNVYFASLLPQTKYHKGSDIKMAADGRTRVRLSVASQFFHNDDTDTLVASGEYSAEDSTSEKVCGPFKMRTASDFMLL